jgi:protein TonB
MNNATLMQHITVLEQERTGQLAKGWVLSIALHGCLMLAVMTAMPKLTLPVENEPFRWEVALVQAPTSAPAAVPPAQSVPEPVPSKPLQPQQQPARPPEPLPQKAATPIQRQDATQPVRREIEPIQREIQPVQRTIEPVQRDIQPVQREVQPIQREPQPHVEADQPARLIEPAREVAAVERATAEVQEIKKVERTAEPLTSEPAQEIAAAVEQPVSQTAPAPLEARETPAPVIQHRTAETRLESEVVARAPAMETPASPPVIERPAPIEQAAIAQPTQPAPAVPSPAPQESVAPPIPPTAAQTSDQPAPAIHEQPPVVARSVTPIPGRKADYGWLAQSLHSRIVELRQYPSIARVNGWEGKVVLRVQIRQDGNLDSVSVVKSSGHETLDNAAMDAVRRACPLHMKHEISSPMVVVQVPINYSLSR